MSLLPAGLNAPDANTISALGNMNSAVGASEERVQRSNDEVISKLSKALEQSETNNKLLKERNTQLAGRVETLEKNLKDLEAIRQAERQACQAMMEALSQKVDKVIQQLNQTTEKLDALQKHYNGHSHTFNIYAPDYAGWKRTGEPSY